MIGWQTHTRAARCAATRRLWCGTTKPYAWVVLSAFVMLAVPVGCAPEREREAHPSAPSASPVRGDPSPMLEPQPSQAITQREAYPPRDIGEVVSSVEIHYLAFHHRQPPLDDPRVRAAFATSVDRDALTHVFAQGHVAHATWFPSGVLGHSPSLGLAFDPNEARALLRQAGFPDGEAFPTITLYHPSGAAWRLLAETLQSQWRVHLGVHMSTQVVSDGGSPAGSGADETPAIRVSRWTADGPEPEGFAAFFLSESHENTSGFASAEYDALVEQGLRASDIGARTRAYERAQAILLSRDVAIVPLSIDVFP